MKGIVITVLAVIGGYAIYQWLTQQRGMGAGQRASAQGSVNLGPVGVAIGINSNVDPTMAGVPSFNELPIANGHGDQVWAAYHANPDSTINGSPNYAPAFGPTENQPGPNEYTVTTPEGV